MEIVLCCHKDWQRPLAPGCLGFGRTTLADDACDYRRINCRGFHPDDSSISARQWHLVEWFIVQREINRLLVGLPFRLL